MSAIRRPLRAAIPDRGRPRILVPSLAVSYWNDVGVPVEEERSTAAGKSSHDDRTTFVTPIDRSIAGIPLKLAPVDLPHVDDEAHAVPHADSAGSLLHHQ